MVSPEFPRHRIPGADPDDPSKPDAEKLLTDALAKAAREDKCVLLEETAPHCGWCVKLARFIAVHHELFDGDYVMVSIDRHQLQHGGQVMERVRTSGNSDAPWVAILDADGKVLITSDGPDGNVGYPVRPQEIDHFMAMLRSTARRLTPKQFATLRKDLESAEPAKAAAAR